MEDFNKRDISKSCKLSEEIQYTQQVIINGVPQQGGKVTVPILICPTCGKTLVKFNQGTTYIQAIETAEKQLSQSLNYCNYCGQKLCFPGIINVDIEKSEE